MDQTSTGTSASKGSMDLWLVTATVIGRDKYYGEMVIEAAGTDDEFKTRVNLRSAKDGSALIREGRSALYDGYAWRGRSKGGVSASPAPEVHSGSDGKSGPSAGS